MTAWQHAEYVRRGFGLLPSDRDDLLAKEDAEQTDEGDQRQRGRAHIQKTIDQAHQNPSTKRQHIRLHWRLSPVNRTGAFRPPSLRPRRHARPAPTSRSESESRREN